MARQPDWREEQAARRAKEKKQEQLMATVFGIIFFAIVLGLTLWIRHSAPCWVFPLHEAPTRCLPGATR